MKQVLILEPDDLVRLKSGHTIQLTDSLLLSFGGRIKREKVEANGAPDDRRAQQKREYQARYREKMKGHRKTPKYACPYGCNQYFVSKNSWGPHRKACPAYKKGGR